MRLAVCFSACLSPQAGFAGCDGGEEAARACRPQNIWMKARCKTGRYNNPQLRSLSDHGGARRIGVQPDQHMATLTKQYLEGVCAACSRRR
jgi:hypothetical protein